MKAQAFTHRIATESDIPRIEEIMSASITDNMRAFLSAEEIVSARESMGLDRTLIADRTYFMIETSWEGEPLAVGCGGWGRRKTLYGGDHVAWRDDNFADPAVDAARIRAMYTRPGWIRRGIGTLLLELGENAARAAGFKTIELGSTVPGEPLYRARGYVEFNREVHISDAGIAHTVIRMRKAL